MHRNILTANQVKLLPLIKEFSRDYYLVGGTARYPGIAAVIEEVTGVKTVVPGDPLLVTPIGIAMHN